MTERLIAILARSGLDDASYTEAVSVLRVLQAEADAGRRLADTVLAHESYQPQAVVTALTSYFGAVRAA